MLDATHFFEVHSSVYSICQISNRLVAIGLANGYVALYDATLDVQVGDVFKLEGAVYALEFDSNSNVLFVGSSKGEFIAVNLSNSEIIYRENLQISIQQIKIQRDQLLVGLAKGVLLVFSQELKRLAEFPLSQFGIRSMVTFGDERLFVGLKSNEILEIETHFFNVVHTYILEENERPTCLNVVMNRQLLFVGTNRGLLHCWKIGTADNKVQFQLHQGAIYGIEFHAGTVASFGFDKNLKFWDEKSFDSKGVFHSTRSLNAGKWLTDSLFVIGGDDKKATVISVSV
ncbi:MAG: hypothetical protein ACKO7C_05350 [Bacteroidota bacterium]